VGLPPLAAPIGQILASQALLHVLSASRYATVVDELHELLTGRWGSPPGPVDATVRRAVELLSDGRGPEPSPPVLDELRARAEGLAASEEELLLLGLFGDAAEALLRTIRGRARGREQLAEAGIGQARAERIRELVRIVQESAVAEVTIEEDDLRVSVRRTDDRVAAPAAEPAADELFSAGAPRAAEVVRVEAPMVGTFYRAPQPGAAPFVDVGDVVAAGQTLCLIEAMKLFNELKAEVDGIVRAVHVENAQAVEFGQLLFELELAAERPLDAL
jgi:oxaloacetate decarboxylase alpha subunit